MEIPLRFSARALYFCPLVLTCFSLRSPLHLQLEIKQLVSSLSDGERGYFIKTNLLLRQRNLISRNALLLNGVWGIMQRANYLAVFEPDPLPVAAGAGETGGGRGCCGNWIFIARCF